MTPDVLEYLKKELQKLSNRITSLEFELEDLKKEKAEKAEKTNIPTKPFMYILPKNSSITGSTADTNTTNESI